MKVVRYNVQNGVKRQQIGYKKLIIAGVASLGMIGGAAIPAMATGSAPTDPGCFGRTRSTNITTGNIAPGPGASGWGHEAANRAGDNGTINQEWTDANCS